MKKTFSAETAQSISSALLRWFSLHKRPLPWRERYSPYEVWISEVMLQQTQMERGVAYFQRWMRRFPDIRAVADASEEEILSTGKAWAIIGAPASCIRPRKPWQSVTELNCLTRKKPLPPFPASAHTRSMPFSPSHSGRMSFLWMPMWSESFRACSISTAP